MTTTLWRPPFLRQSAPEWGQTRIGDSTSTIAQVGCLLTAVAQASRLLGAQPRCRPDELAAAAHLARGLAGARAVLPIVADCAGLQAPRTLRHEGEAQILRATVEGALDAGWLVLLRVDRDPGPQEQHHWILAIGERDGAIDCADPATGRAVVLSSHTLRGTSDWRSGAKQYVVDAAQPIGPRGPTG